MMMEQARREAARDSTKSSELRKRTDYFIGQMGHRIAPKDVSMVSTREEVKKEGSFRNAKEEEKKMKEHHTA